MLKRIGPKVIGDPHKESELLIAATAGRSTAGRNMLSENDNALRIDGVWELGSG